MKNILENIAAIAVILIAIIALFAAIIGIDIFVKTQIAHQPAKCVFVKCVLVVEP